MTPPICRRGEIWSINFDPARGSEQKGVRPALIVQNDVGNRYAGTTIVAAITTSIKHYPVTVVLDHKRCGLKEPSMVNLAQILTIDKERLKKKIGSIGTEKLDQVNTALAISLAIITQDR